MESSKIFRNFGTCNDDWRHRWYSKVAELASGRIVAHDSGSAYGLLDGVAHILKVLRDVHSIDTLVSQPRRNDRLARALVRASLRKCHCIV